MPPRFKSVAVIGAGPSGISSAKALQDEKTFEKIRVFERRANAGGIWHYDPVPDVFSCGSGPTPSSIPECLPCLLPAHSEDTTARSAIYSALDSNVGATAMCFTHKPFPDVNSALSIERFGPSNPTRPFRVVAKYLQDIFTDYIPLASFNTTVERVEKINGKWTLTLRQPTSLNNQSEPQDYWWQEEFDAVIVASGHNHIPFIPNIPGIEAACSKFPGQFEHSKSFRSKGDYAGKQVLIVGGSVSASDLVLDLYETVTAPLEVSLRGRDEIREAAWELPGVSIRPVIKQLHATESGVVVEFNNGTTSTPDKIIFATGYWTSYPFLSPNYATVTPHNRLSGFYQHMFNIDDPSLAVVGQVINGINFRIYEYQAVAIARYFAGRNGIDLPVRQDQILWETERLKYKGPTAKFHEVKPDFREYFGFLCDLAGAAAVGTDGYSLPRYEEELSERAFEVLKLKDQYYKSLQGVAVSV